MFKIQRLFALLVLCIYLSPNIFFADKARYLIHDNLNSNTVWLKNLAASGQLLASNHALVPNALGGLERAYYPSELNLLPWLYRFFTPLVAYNINICLIHLIAFIGMIMLLKSHFMRKEQETLAYWCALLFALLPFWPGGGISIAGQSLLIFAFLNLIERKKSALSLGIICFFPFYSSFFFSNAFFIAAAGIYWIYEYIKTKSFNLLFLSALLVFTALSLGCEYRLILLRLLDHIITNREDLGAGSMNFFGIAQVFFKHWVYGHYHFHSYHFPFLLVGIGAAYLLTKDKSRRKRILSLVSITGLLSLLFALFQWKSFVELIAGVLPLFQMRFQALSPVAWYILFSCAASGLIIEKPRLQPLVFGFIGVAVLFSFFPLKRVDYYGSDYAENSFFRSLFDKSNQDFQTFDGYYQTALFDKVAQQIPKTDYVGCLGMPSEVAQYNGYKTIGGYFPIYPLRYFEQMLHCNGEELIKSKKIMHSKRPELMSHELQQKKIPIQHISWNFDTLRNLRCKYIFSTSPIRVHELQNEQVFHSGNTLLYVYQITD